ncbi:putative mitochondrial ribosomal protein L4 isoform a [Schistosoma japonicum]|uniref:Putative mitochondrial ribosomal protein L4 isoform a n=1 Tax=Schistosoma japonicum TaxID=6182 RepID=A0A4Z2DHQ9_SCHJA|nr:putative mitochondrial ribosomal protein L4 isoform a [Schistosoma japonicum]
MLLCLQKYLALRQRYNCYSLVTDAYSLACSSYENHVKNEISPESSAFKFNSISPRATHPGRGLTLMPVHSLNVWSMVHHDTLVISLKALEILETKLIAAQTVVVRDESDEHLFASLNT